jgi:hypothetical protein
MAKLMSNASSDNYKNEQISKEIKEIWITTQIEVIELVKILTGDNLTGVLGCIKEVCKNSCFLIFQSKDCLTDLLNGLLTMCQNS